MKRIGRKEVYEQYIQKTPIETLAKLPISTKEPSIWINSRPNSKLSK
jgi:hypothetical protein